MLRVLSLLFRLAIAIPLAGIMLVALALSIADPLVSRAPRRARVEPAPAHEQHTLEHENVLAA